MNGTSSFTREKTAVLSHHVVKKNVYLDELASDCHK